VLITRRPEDSHLGGFWEFPGGKIREGESPEQALRREIREELDLNVEVDDLFWRAEFEYDVKVVDIGFYFYRIEAGSPQIRHKGVADSRWVFLPELNKYRFPPADQAVVQKLAQWQRSAKRD